jgi:hypothetical protein
MAKRTNKSDVTVNVETNNSTPETNESEVNPADLHLVGETQPDVSIEETQPDATETEKQPLPIGADLSIAQLETRARDSFRVGAVSALQDAFHRAMQVYTERRNHMRQALGVAFDENDLQSDAVAKEIVKSISQRVVGISGNGKPKLETDSTVKKYASLVTPLIMIGVRDYNTLSNLIAKTGGNLHMLANLADKFKSVYQFARQVIAAGLVPKEFMDSANGEVKRFFGADNGQQRATVAILISASGIAEWNKQQLGFAIRFISDYVKKLRAAKVNPILGTPKSITWSDVREYALAEEQKVLEFNFGNFDITELSTPISNQSEMVA